MKTIDVREGDTWTGLDDGKCAWGFVAADSRDKSIIVVNRTAASRPSDNRKWAAIRVWAANQWIDITATPTTVSVKKSKAGGERKETKR